MRDCARDVLRKDLLRPAVMQGFLAELCKDSIRVLLEVIISIIFRCFVLD